MDIEFSISSDESVSGIMRKGRRNRTISSSSSDTAIDWSTTEEENSEAAEKCASEEEYSEVEELLIKETDCDDPNALYKLFITDAILEIIGDETNRYAVQCIVNSAYGRRQHHQAWNSVSKSQVPEIRLYWSKKAMYANARVMKAMKRGPFLAILQSCTFLVMLRLEPRIGYTKSEMQLTKFFVHSKM
ncbi:uncharacterized protein LOC143219936 [Lasioglossum baleicum]|uniref:uncharacterized protein LOC143219936 n=1 Tax=Lasioglossum baleicum TaxID=434251 RepID=UPI003FCD50D5